MKLDRDTATVDDSREPAPRWTRFAPLSGMVFFLLLVASAVTSLETPSDYAPGTTVLSLFKAHESAAKISNLLAALSVVFLIFFASWLFTHLRGSGAGAPASAVFGGAVVVAVGGAARAGIGWALASGHDKLEPGAAQALHVVFTSHYPAVVGIATFMFAACLSILRTGAFPRWLGWAALPIALVAIAPPTLIPLIGTGVWIAAASIVMSVRGGHVRNAA